MDSMLQLPTTIAYPDTGTTVPLSTNGRMIAAPDDHTMFALDALATFVAALLVACPVAAWCVWPQRRIAPIHPRDIRT